MFPASARFMPEQEELHLGDTLYLESVIPASLPDQNGQLVDYSNAKALGGTLYISELAPGDTIPSAAVSAFNYFAMEGEIYKPTDALFPENFRQTRYAEVNGFYRLAVRLIPKRAGSFCLGLGWVYSRGKKNEGGCESASFEMIVANSDQNLHLLENFQGYPVTETNQQNTYCFRVEE